MANIINYLNVSLYQGQFTYKHEQIIKTPFTAPSIEDIMRGYNNLIY